MSSDGPCSLPEPKPGQPYIEVSALEAGVIRLPTKYYVQGAGPEEAAMCPSLAFSLLHKPSGSHLVFDLGLRREIASYPPWVHDLIQNKGYPYYVPQTAEESLRKGGIAPEDVKTVILSHVHFDHVGDTQAFPNAHFILGPRSREKLEDGYPSNPQSGIITNAVPFDRTRFLAETDFTTSVGPFPRALDYFGDGSLYIVDAPGHCAGHINVLARTSDDGSWICLTADSAHDARILTGEKEVAFYKDDTGHFYCPHDDKETADEHIRRLRALWRTPRVHVLLAHDHKWYEENKRGDAFLPGVIPPRRS